MLFPRRIRPFKPTVDLPMTVVEPSEAALGDSDLKREYGFEANSMQHNFFKTSSRPSSSKSKKIVVLLHTSNGQMPMAMDHDTVVARLFGVVRGTDLEIWHLSVNKKHPLNFSNQGTHWGVYGVRLDTTPTKARWYDSDGRQLTKQNSEQLLRGSPNPFATNCLYRTIRQFKCKSARQNESMACAQLFDPQYDHTTHPATQLIYRTLGFERSFGLDAYSWNASTMVDMQVSWNRFMFRMNKGIPAILDDSTQRFSDVNRIAVPRISNCFIDGNADR